MFPRIVRSAACFLIVGAAGCDPTPVVKTVHVTGTVKYKGQPVVDADVGFMNTSATGKSAAGKTDAEGRFTLTTLVAGAKMQDGAMAGDYKVTVAKKLAGGAGQMPAPSGDPATMTPEEKQKMMDERAALQQQQQRQNQPADPGKIESELPVSYADVKKTELTATVKEGGTNDFPFELVGD
jgi:hypothetical protein